MNELDADAVHESISLPDDPLSMPPPHWRSSGVIFQIVYALGELAGLLNRLVPIHKRIDAQLTEYYNSGRHERDPNGDAFASICDDLWGLESEITMKAHLLCFLAAIKMEEDLNCFCAYNLHKDVVEAIEKLSPPEKLLIATTLVGKPNVKGTAYYANAKKLTTWRNAFAHGHCVDRPTGSIRKNHFISPPTYPGVPDSIARMKELAWGSIRLGEYLEEITRNPYIGSVSGDVDTARETLNEIARFHIEPAEGQNEIYEIRKR